MEDPRQSSEVGSGAVPVFVGPVLDRGCNAPGEAQLQNSRRLVASTNSEEQSAVSLAARTRIRQLTAYESAICCPWLRFCRLSHVFSNIFDHLFWSFNCEMGCMSEATSTHYEFARFQVIIEARIADLERGIRQRDGILVERSPDQLDQIQRASERDLAISNIDRGSKQLRDARAALRRIRDGSFGVCEQCEEEIPLKRLVAIPWASLCIQCQEALDSRDVPPEATDIPLRKAA
jgi:DnaK suppressor protein